MHMIASSRRSRTIRFVRPILAIAAVAVLVSGCSTLRSMVGLDKDAPDEFQVVNRAPLSMPPDFGLRAPTPGASRPQEVSTTDQARQIVIERQTNGNQSIQPIAGRSAAETAFLKEAHATNADPNIRREVDTDTSVLADTDKRWIDSLLFWKGPRDNSSVVDAEKESQRIRENAALNKPVTTGETPTIKKKDTSWF